MAPLLPVVAVSATSEVVRDRPQVRLNQRYVDALQRAGVIPVVVPPLGTTAIEALIQRVDGLVLTGGEDVDPSLYGQAPHPRAESPNPARDRSELGLIHAAHARRLPTLAICRGAQILNVAFGGTLIQDIPSQVPGALPHACALERTARVHDVALESGTTLQRMLGEERITVNSLHHQAADRPGHGLRASARSSDGLIEALEWGSDDWWMVGVQWHPEELDQSPETWDRTLFGAFAAAVSSSTATGPRRAPGA